MRSWELTDEKRAIFTPLLQAARAGSQDALAEAVQLIEEPLRKWVRKHIPPDMQRNFDSVDVMQMTYVDALKDFKNLDGETVDDFVFWLMAIAMHNCEDLKKYHGRDCRCHDCISLESETAQHAVVERSAEHVELAAFADEGQRRRHWLREALRDMALNELDVLRARFWDGLTYRQMAERFNRTPEAIRKVCDRLLKKLRGRLSE